MKKNTPSNPHITSSSTPLSLSSSNYPNATFPPPPTPLFNISNPLNNPHNPSHIMVAVPVQPVATYPPYPDSRPVSSNDRDHFNSRMFDPFEFPTMFPNTPTRIHTTNAIDVELMDLAPDTPPPSPRSMPYPSSTPPSPRPSVPLPPAGTYVIPDISVTLEIPPCSKQQSHDTFKKLARSSFEDMMRDREAHPQAYTTVKFRKPKEPKLPLDPQERFNLVYQVITDMSNGNVKEALRSISTHNISDTELSRATLDQIKIIETKRHFPEYTGTNLRRPVPPPQPGKYDVVNPTWLPIINELPSFAYLAAHAATYGRDHTSIGYSKQEFTKAIKLANKFLESANNQGIVDEIRSSWTDFRSLLSGMKQFRETVTHISDSVKSSVPKIVHYLSIVLNISNFILDVVTGWKLLQTDPKFAAFFISLKAVTWTFNAATSTTLIDWVLQLIQPTPEPFDFPKDDPNFNTNLSPPLRPPPASTWKPDPPPSKPRLEVSVEFSRTPHRHIFDPLHPFYVDKDFMPTVERNDIYNWLYYLGVRYDTTQPDKFNLIFNHPFDPHMIDKYRGLTTPSTILYDSDDDSPSSSPSIKPPTPPPSASPPVHHEPFSFANRVPFATPTTFHFDQPPLLVREGDATPMKPVDHQGGPEPVQPHVAVSIFKQLWHMATGLGDAEVTLSQSKRLHSLFGSMNTIVSFAKNVKDLILELVNLYYFKFLGDGPAEKRALVISTLAKMNKLLDSSATDADYSKSVSDLIDSASLLEEDLITHDLRTLVPSFSRRLDQLRLRKVALDAIISSNATKVEAVGIYMTSTPGLGKNTMLEPLVLRVCKLNNIKVDEHPVYMAPIDSEYFDALRPDIHYAVCLDEFGQTTDPTKLSNQTDFSMAMVASTATKANHSVAEEKRKHKFLHYIFFLLANAMTPIEKSLKVAFHGAWCRRFWNVHTNCSHPAYNSATGKWSHNVEQLEELYIRYYTYDVSEHYFSNGVISTINTVRMTYIEFANWLASQTKRKLAEFERVEKVKTDPVPHSIFTFPPALARDLLAPAPSKNAFIALTTFLEKTQERDYALRILGKWNEYMTQWIKNVPLAQNPIADPNTLSLQLSKIFDAVTDYMFLAQTFATKFNLKIPHETFLTLCLTTEKILADTAHLPTFKQLAATVPTEGIVDWTFAKVTAAVAGAAAFLAGTSYLAVAASSSTLADTYQMGEPWPLLIDHVCTTAYLTNLLNHSVNILMDGRIYRASARQVNKLTCYGWFLSNNKFCQRHIRGFRFSPGFKHRASAYLTTDARNNLTDTAVDILCDIGNRNLQIRTNFTYIAPANDTPQYPNDTAGVIIQTVRAIPTPYGAAHVDIARYALPRLEGTIFAITSIDRNIKTLDKVKHELTSLGWLPKAIGYSAAIAVGTFAFQAMFSYLVKWVSTAILSFFVAVSSKSTETPPASSEGKVYDAGQLAKAAKAKTTIPLPFAIAQGVFDSFNSKGFAEQLAVISENEYSATLNFADPDAGVVYASSPFLARFYKGTTFGATYHSLHYHLTHPHALSTITLAKQNWTSLPIPLTACTIRRFSYKDDTYVQDYVFVTVPPRFIQPRSKIIDYFPKRDQITDVYLANAKYILPTVVGPLPNIVVRDLGKGDFIQSLPTRSVLRDGSRLEQVVTHAVKFKGLSKAGDCNALYGCDNPRVTTPFFAYHDAGDSTSNLQYGGLLFREMLEAGCADSGPSSLPITDPANPADHQSILTDVLVCPNPDLAQKHGIYRGLLPKAYDHHLHSKTQIIRSRLFPSAKPTKSPAILTYEALKRAYAKADRPDFRVTNPMYPIAVVKYGRRILDCKPLTSMTLTTSEVLNGHFASLQSHPIRTTTSPGFLKPLAKGTPGKTAFISDVDGVKSVTPLFQPILDAYRSSCDEGVPAPVEQANLKDELRTNDRVEDLASRRFFTGDLRDFIVGQEEFGAFWIAFDANPDLTRCFVGINPSSDRWGKMVNDLKEGGRKLMQSDISKNDIDAYRYNLWMIYEKIIEPWYAKYDKRSPEEFKLHANRRKNIWLSQLGRNVQVGRIVIQSDHGISSGKFRTSSLVTIIRHLDYMASAMRLLSIHYPSEANAVLNDDALLYDTFRMYHYGDDAARSVPPIYPLINNNTTHDQLLSEHGILTTRPDKADDSAPPDYYDWSEFDFLSRDADIRDSICYARLREDTIFNIPLWRRDDAIPDSEALPILLDSALTEWFLYGKEKFVQKRLEYLEELQSLNITAPLLTYEKAYSDWRVNY